MFDDVDFSKVLNFVCMIKGVISIGCFGGPILGPFWGAFWGIKRYKKYPKSTKIKVVVSLVMIPIVTQSKRNTL